MEDANPRPLTLTQASRMEDALRQAQLDIVTVQAAAVLDEQQHHVRSVDQQQQHVCSVDATEAHHTHTHAKVRIDSQAATRTATRTATRVEVREALSTLDEDKGLPSRVEVHEASTRETRRSMAAADLQEVPKVQVQVPEAAEGSAREERVADKAAAARPRGLRTRNLNAM